MSLTTASIPVTLPCVRDVTTGVANKHYNKLPAMRDEQNRPLYDLWRLASHKGYSLRLEGAYIRLIPLRTQGGSGLARSFLRNKDGIKKARAWLDIPETPQRTGAVNSARE